MSTRKYVMRFIEIHKNRIYTTGVAHMTLGQRKLYEVIKRLAQNTGNILRRKDIEIEYKRTLGKPLNMLPSDFCYNMTNSGPDFECKFLLRIGQGLYEFVDTQWPGDGRRINVEWDPKGRDVPKDLNGLIFNVGEYVAGRYEWDFTGLDPFLG